MSDRASLHTGGSRRWRPRRGDAVVTRVASLVCMLRAARPPCRKLSAYRPNARAAPAVGAQRVALRSGRVPGAPLRAQLYVACCVSRIACCVSRSVCCAAATSTRVLTRGGVAGDLHLVHLLEVVREPRRVERHHLLLLAQHRRPPPLPAAAAIRWAVRGHARALGLPRQRGEPS